MSRPKKEDGTKYIRKDISMDPAQYEKLAEYCDREERSVSWVIRKAIDNYLSA